MEIDFKIKAKDVEFLVEYVNGCFLNPLNRKTVKYPEGFDGLDESDSKAIYMIVAGMVQLFKGQLSKYMAFKILRGTGMTLVEKDDE